MGGGARGRGGRADKVEWEISIIDAGLVTTIDPHYTRLFNRFLSSLCRGDADELATLLLRFKVSLPVCVCV